MTTEVAYKPSSYKNSKGKWVPSGSVIVTDTASVTEFTETYDNDKAKGSKSEADSYFLENTKKKLKELKE